MGVLDRLILDDGRWERMAAYVIGDDAGSSERDLPDVFGSWNSAFRRFSRWSTKGMFDGVPSTTEWKEASWARFYLEAPGRRQSSAERYSGVKRA